MRVVFSLIALAFVFSVSTIRAHGMSWRALEQIRMGKSVAGLDSALSADCASSALDSLGIRRFADSLFGFSCELIPVADGDSVDAIFVRFHASSMTEDEFGMTYDMVVNELTSKYGKPDEFRRSAYSPLLKSIMRRHAIWDDSTVQVLLLGDRDSKFAPLLDLVVARASACLGGTAKTEDPPSSTTGLMAWLLNVTPAIQPSYLMHPKSRLDPDPASQFEAVETMPTVLVEQKPVYPAEAIYKGGEGTVWIKALVDEGGEVRAVRLAKPSQTGFDFESTCITAAFGNKYKPATRHGVPVPIWVTYPVEFRMK